MAVAHEGPSAGAREVNTVEYVDDLEWETQERLRKIDVLVERLRDAKQRMRLGIAVADPKGLDVLLEEAADELEECGVDVSMVGAQDARTRHWNKEPRGRLSRRPSHTKGGA